MAVHFGFYDDWRTAQLHCSKCGWRGAFQDGLVEYYNELIDCSCPQCDDLVAPILAIVSYPTTIEAYAQGEKLPELDRMQVGFIEKRWRDFELCKLQETTPLPEINESSFTLLWDFFDAGLQSETLIRHRDTIIFREPVFYEGYERYIEVAEILRKHYGPALLDLVPTELSGYHLYGDSISSPQMVRKARQRIFSVDASD